MKKPKPLPKHLKKYIVAQDYSRYTAEDQAVWRYIMRQLKFLLKESAHPAYESGLKKTGITTEHIPKISDMNKMLNKFGWGAVPVSGFIPPAAFMEFQSLCYLPIASEIRCVDNILYTPAPDIVHEAAGHAPILVDKNFSDYLKAYAEVASHSISSKQDFDLYEAIRLLSDAKEDTNVKPAKIKSLEKNLDEKIKAVKYTSEAGYLGIMNWWTAEYGLIGGLNDPKIFGAGLLSSIGESRECLESQVKKVPLDMNCLDYSYDITEPQPQLFVTPSFKKLTSVLKQLSEKMSYKLGGAFGLDNAIKSETLNTVQLNSGLQISGQVDSYKIHNDDVCLVKLSGPSQLSYEYKELTGHGTRYHAHGYSSPIGKLIGAKKCLSKMNATDLKKHGIVKNKVCVLQYESGIVVTGKLTSILKRKNKNLLFTFKECSVVYNNEILFHPSWGTFDLACGETIPSVFGGPADRATYGDTADFKAKKVKPRKLTASRKKLMKLYEEARRLRDLKSKPEEEIENLFSKYISTHKREWLLGVEIFELSIKKKTSAELRVRILNHLNDLSVTLKPYERAELYDGIKLAKMGL